MGIKFSDNAASTLLRAATAVSTEIVLAAGSGASFPELPNADDYFYVTIFDSSNTEVIKCTARINDVLTVVRGIEPLAWNIGSKIELRITTSVLNDIVTAAAAAVATVAATVAANTVAIAVNDDNFTALDTAANAADAATRAALATNTAAIATNTANIATAAASSIANATIPVGTVMLFAMSAIPENWLECNASPLQISEYPTLFAVIGYAFSATPGSRTAGEFLLPNMQGKFVRNWNSGRPNINGSVSGIDEGRVFGSVQRDSFKAHTHSTQSSEGGTVNILPQGEQGNGSIIQTGSTGGVETRPVNIALMYCIKYR